MRKALLPFAHLEEILPDSNTPLQCETGENQGHERDPGRDRSIDHGSVHDSPTARQQRLVNASPMHQAIMTCCPATEAAAAKRMLRPLK